MNRILVLGGARSGKSTWAEKYLSSEPEVDYVATSPARPEDPEWVERIKIHVSRRPSNWNTIETQDIPKILITSGPAVLVDCLGNWLTAVCDQAGIWADPDSIAANDLLQLKFDELIQAWKNTKREVVAVSNEVGLGIVPATKSGRRFRDDLGRLNMAIAAQCDQVYLLVAGIASRLK